LLVVCEYTMSCPCPPHEYLRLFSERLLSEPNFSLNHLEISTLRGHLTGDS
jgi:hypothetical protein